MNISRKSWHYRFMMKFGGDSLNLDLISGRKQFTTCTYIRALLGTMFSVFAFCCGVLFVALAAIATLGAMGYTAFIAFTTGGLPPQPTLTLVLGFVGWMIAVMCSGVWLVVNGLNLLLKFISKKHAQRQRAKRLKKQEEPSVFAKALKDRKDGICTLVKFSE